MNGKFIAELDEEIERLTQVRTLLADGLPSSTAKHKHGLSLVPKGDKVDRRKGKRSPAVLTRMRAAQRKRWSNGS